MASKVPTSFSYVPVGMNKNPARLHSGQRQRRPLKSSSVRKNPPQRGVSAAEKLLLTVCRRNKNTRRCFSVCNRGDESCVPPTNPAGQALISALLLGDCPELHGRGSAPGYVTGARSTSVRKVRSAVAENPGQSSGVTQPCMLEHNANVFVNVVYIHTHTVKSLYTP